MSCHRLSGTRRWPAEIPAPSHALRAWILSPQNDRDNVLRKSCTNEVPETRRSQPTALRLLTRLTSRREIVLFEENWSMMLAGLKHFVERKHPLA